MFRVIEIENIARYKRSLLLQSEADRKFIIEQVESIQQTTLWVQKFNQRIKNNYSYIFLLVPFLGLFRKTKRLSKVVGKVAGATKLFTKVKSIFGLVNTLRTFRSVSQRPH
jgi:hypothetical protein